MSKKTKITKNIITEITKLYGKKISIIPITKEKYTIIDKEDYDKVMQYHWCASESSGKYYAVYRSKRIKLHRLIMNAKEGEVIDHINGDPLDNRKCNLRFATHSQNAINRRSPISKSGFKGVCYKAQNTKPFLAQIQAYKKKIYIGSYSTAEEAAIAYDIKAIELFGEFALTNKMMGLYGKKTD